MLPVSPRGTSLKSLSRIRISVPPAGLPAVSGAARRSCGVAVAIMFDTRSQPRIDLEVGSWYVSTYPNSFFVTGLTAALVTDDARWNMRGRNLAVHRSGKTEQIRFDTAADVLDALTNRFGIDVADLGDRADVEARVNEVLDS